MQTAALPAAQTGRTVEHSLAAHQLLQRAGVELLLLLLLL
jgi:hypothetical protein